MQISEQVLLDALRAVANQRDVPENTFTVRELMAATGLSMDATRNLLRQLVSTGKVGVTRSYRQTLLGGYATRLPAYYLIEQ